MINRHGCVAALKTNEEKNFSAFHTVIIYLKQLETIHLGLAKHWNKC